jgi:methylmalonyl-CoA mutase
MLYEQRKHDGSLPLIGVNTFLNPGPDEPVELALSRATEAEKRGQLTRVNEFKAAHAEESAAAVERLKQAATTGDNIFAVLMDAARVCTLQQVTEAFFEVGGQYRRNV